MANREKTCELSEIYEQWKQEILTDQRDYLVKYLDAICTHFWGTEAAVRADVVFSKEVQWLQSGGYSQDCRPAADQLTSLRGVIQAAILLYQSHLMIRLSQVRREAGTDDVLLSSKDAKKCFDDHLNKNS